MLNVEFIKFFMKKIFLLFILFAATFCTPEMIENLGCMAPSYEQQETAQSLYNDMFSKRVSMSYEEARKIFGCYYARGDQIYSFTRVFDEGYILVRGNNAIIYKIKE